LHLKKTHLNIIFIFLFISHLTSCVSVKKHNAQISDLHSVSALHGDLDQAYLQLQKHHPLLYQYTLKSALDFKIDSLKKTIDTPMNSKDFYEKFAPVLFALKHGHIGIYPPFKKDTKQEEIIKKKQKFEFYALDFEFLQNKLYIISSNGLDTTLIGAEVLGIADESITSLVKKYKNWFSSDGYNTTFYNKRIGLQFKNLYYKDKRFKDSLKLTLKFKDSIFNRTFKHIPKIKSIHSKVKEDSLKTVLSDKSTVLKLSKKEKRKYNALYGYNPARHNYNRNLSFVGTDSTTALIKIRAFARGNYKDFYAQSFEKIASTKTRNLILDLRYNGGGRGAEVLKLYSYLTDKKFRFFKESEIAGRTPLLKSTMSNTNSILGKLGVGLISPFILMYDLSRVKKKNGKLYYKLLSKKQRPNPLNFKGNLYVLINGFSYSAASILSTHLHGSKRAIFVGEETGGAYNGTVAGFFKIYELPNTKIKIRIGLLNLQAPFKQEPDGYGIKPQVQIIPTIADRKLKKDPELEWVLKDIETKL
jgi:C-terminal processing protease CtpA/Prc